MAVEKVWFDPKTELPEAYEPHSVSLSDSYLTALRELSDEHPSVKLKQWLKFNGLTGGFRAREFSILCGATGIGKTTLLSNISAQLLLSQERHYIASVETGGTDFVKRTMSVLAGRDLNTGEAIPMEVLRHFNQKFGHIYNEKRAFISLYEDRVPVENLLADIHWHVKNKGVKIAILDNLNFFMEVQNEKNQVVEMDRVVHECIIFCKKVDVHLIMVMHPKKTDHGRVESEFDIKGSSTAVQESHNIFLFNRPSDEAIRLGLATPADRELKIAKMRRKGKNVGASIILKNVDGSGTRYEEGGVL